VRRVLACLARWSGRVVVIAPPKSSRISQLTPTFIAKFSTHNMAGFKRGGSVGSAGKTIKKARAKKRAASNDEDSPPRNTKKSKGEDNKPAPLAPELNEDDEGRPYISVSSELCLHAASLTYGKLKAGGLRRVTISEFKGVPLIDIREYYTNPAGELKPGNKVGRPDLLTIYLKIDVL
jgi:hypothetical protein